MAKVSIVFSDNRDGGVSVNVQFKPKFNHRKPTKAQIEAARVLKRIADEHPDEFAEGLENAE